MDAMRHMEPMELHRRARAGLSDLSYQRWDGTLVLVRPFRLSPPCLKTGGGVDAGAAPERFQHGAYPLAWLLLMCLVPLCVRACLSTSVCFNQWMLNLLMRADAASAPVRVVLPIMNVAVWIQPQRQGASPLGFFL